MKNLKVEYWKEGRYIIIDENSGEIVDDAQGYGYKDKQKATKAMWWKFSGGKEKKDDEKKLFNAWIKIEINKNILNEINNTIEDNFKEIALKEVTINEIIKEIENDKNITIPKYHASQMSRLADCSKYNGWLNGMSESTRTQVRQQTVRNL